MRVDVCVYVITIAIGTMIITLIREERHLLHLVSSLVFSLSRSFSQESVNECESQDQKEKRETKSERSRRNVPASERASKQARER